METINCSWIMTDKHLNKNSLLNASDNPYCFNFGKYFFLRLTAFHHKRVFFVFRSTAFVLKWLPWLQQKYHSRISDVLNYSSIDFYGNIMSTNGNIRDCLLFNCAFIIADVIQFIVLQFLQNLYKNSIFGFSVVYSRKGVQVSIFEVEYLENGLTDFSDFGLILQDYEWPFS